MLYVVTSMWFANFARSNVPSVENSEPSLYSALHPPSGQSMLPRGGRYWKDGEKVCSGKGMSIVMLVVSAFVFDSQ